MHGVPKDVLRGLKLQKMAQKWPKTAIFGQFILFFSYSTVTTSILILQIVTYHQSEQ